MYFPLTVRPWRPGDRMAMPYGRKKVKKLLLEARVAADVREGLPVVADASGSVVWIPGVADPPEADAGSANLPAEDSEAANPAGRERGPADRPGCWVGIRLDRPSPNH